MTTKEWLYLKSELDTYSTNESIFLHSETSEETCDLDETVGISVPIFTKKMSVAHLNATDMI